MSPSIPNLLLLKVLKCTNKFCNGTNLVTQLFSVNVNISDLSPETFSSDITVGTDGLSIISFYHPVSKDLVVFKCTTVDCTTFVTHTIDAQDDAGLYHSITIGNDGYPVIAYRHFVGGLTPTELKVAKCLDHMCSTSAIFSVDSNNTGEGIDIV